MQPQLIMSWKNAHEVNPGVKVNLWLVNPWVNLSMEQPALSQQSGLTIVCDGVNRAMLSL